MINTVSIQLTVMYQYCINTRTYQYINMINTVSIQLTLMYQYCINTRTYRFIYINMINTESIQFTDVSTLYRYMDILIYRYDQHCIHPRSLSHSLNVHEQNFSVVARRMSQNCVALVWQCSSVSSTPVCAARSNQWPLKHQHILLVRECCLHRSQQYSSSVTEAGANRTTHDQTQEKASLSIQ